MILILSNEIFERTLKFNILLNKILNQLQILKLIQKFIGFKGLKHGYELENDELKTPKSIWIKVLKNNNFIICNF
jgi:hypothetical protein